MVTTANFDISKNKTKQNNKQTNKTKQSKNTHTPTCLAYTSEDSCVLIYKGWKSMEVLVALTPLRW